jgi:hypothetical protein
MVSITDQSILGSLGHCPNLSQTSPLFRDFLPHESLTPPAHIPQEQVRGNKSSRDGWNHRVAIMADCFLHRTSSDGFNTNAMINGREDSLSDKKTLSLNLLF